MATRGEGNVRKRAKGWQADFRWEGQRLRETLKTEGAAWDWIKASRDALQKGDAVVLHGKVVMKTVDNAVTAEGDGDLTYYTIDKLVQFTYDVHWAGTANAKDSHRNAKDVAKVIGGTKHPTKITSKAVLEMVATLRTRGVANATINRKLSALATMLKYGLKLGVVKAMPTWDWLAEDNARSRDFSDAEERTIIDGCERLEMTDLRDLYVLLVDTGMRLTEALKLTTRDVEKYEALAPVRVWGNVRASKRKDSEANKRTKNVSSKSIPMTQRVVDALHHRRACLPVGETRFFHTIKDKHHAGRLWDRLREDLGKMDDPEFILHSCRHTFASRLARKGATTMQLMMLGGWKTESMVKRYSHLRASDTTSVIATIGDGYNPLSGTKSVAKQ